MNWSSIFLIAFFLVISPSVAESREFKSGEQLMETISGINYDTDWDGVQSFRENAPTCSFSAYEIDGKFYLDIYETAPNRDEDELVTIFFSANTPFIYSQRSPNEESFFRMVGGETRFIAVDLTYYENEEQGQKAKIRIRTGKRAGKRAGTCIVPAEF